MTEVPGTDRDQARANVGEETPLVPEAAQGAADDTLPAGDGDDGERVKPAAGSTDLVVEP
jgi:hypothetical protein